MHFEILGATILLIRKTLSNFGNVFGNVTNLYFKNQGEKDMKVKKFLSVALATVLSVGMLAGCSNSNNSSGGSDSSEKGKVYYLSFKPEQEEQWKEIAKKTNELMKPGSFVIFKTDIDVDSLIKWKIAFKRSMEMIIWKELKWKITL